MAIHLHRGKPWWRSGWASFVPLVAVVAGFMFATSAQTSAGTDLRSSGRTDLADLVRAQDRAVREKAEAVRQLQGEVDGLTARAAPGSGSVARLRAQAAKLDFTVGIQPVTGPALSVSLNDSRRSLASLPSYITADDLVVHQQDVQTVVNAMWAGGAEAMMLQDQRVISTSAVRCVGNTLILQGRVYSPPYVIQAIGDVAGMRVALDRSPAIKRYLEYVEQVGVGYEVTNKGQATFPAYAGSLGLSAAKAQG